VAKFSGFQMISLDKLSVSENLALPVNEVEVVSLAESMAQRFNPAICVLTVTGEDKEFSEDNNYSVIDGVHRLKALNLLDSQGKFEQLPGIKGRKIECFVLTETGDPAIDNYCNLRSNEQVSQHQGNSSENSTLHNLIYVFVLLNKTYKDREKALTAMERMSRLKRIGPEDLTALRKIGTWPEASLEHLVDVLKKFERYQTNDATGRGNRKNLQKGLRMPLKKNIFKMISKCSAEFFETNYPRVLDRTASLKEILKENEAIVEKEKDKRIIANEAAVASFDVLQNKYPDKITKDVVKRFSGAIPWGKKRNTAGEVLVKFVKGLDAEDFKETVLTEHLETILDFGLEKLTEFDIVVFNIKDEHHEYVDTLIDSVAVQRKEYMAVMLVLNSGKEFSRVLAKLEYWSTQNSIQVAQILFEKPNNAGRNESLIEENVVFSVIFGKFHVFKPPLSVLNGTMKASLKDVIDRISPPVPKIAMVLPGKQEIVKIHKGEDDDDSIVTYFASKHVLEKFMMRNDPPVAKRGRAEVMEGGGDAEMDDEKDTTLMDGEEDGEEMSGDEESDQEIFVEDMSMDEGFEGKGSTSNIAKRKGGGANMGSPSPGQGIVLDSLKVEKFKSSPTGERRVIEIEKAQQPLVAKKPLMVKEKENMEENGQGEMLKGFQLYLAENKDSFGGGGQDQMQEVALSWKELDKESKEKYKQARKPVNY